MYLLANQLEEIDATSICKSNHMPSKVWDESTYPFLYFNGATVEV